MHPFNVYLPMFEEVILSFSKGCSEYFYREWKRMPETELAHLLQHYDLSKIEKIIVVGAGAIPFTALYLSKHLRKPAYALERNSITYHACRQLMRRMNARGVRVVKASGESFEEYENSLVIIVLQVCLKQSVMEKALRGGNIVVVRVPLANTGEKFESIALKGREHTSVEHDSPSMISVFLA